MNNIIYYVYGGRIIHPTTLGYTLPNQSQLRNTYFGNNTKITPSSFEFGIDTSSRQNDQDSRGRRAYTFLPFEVPREAT